jgi:polysaccharide export outer membrane protein
MRLNLSRRRISWWQLAIGLVLATVLTACGTTGRYPQAPAVASSSGHVYKIAPLDVMAIAVWPQADLSGRVTVRPDGRISLPLIEDMQAAGHTPVELARDIEKRLSLYVQNPAVTVQMQGAAGASAEQVRVIGEAAKPQAIACRQNMTLLDLMIQVGGLTDFADGNSAVLVRGAEQGTKYGLRLKDLLKRGDMSANIEVVPGDIIIVPQAVF